MMKKRTCSSVVADQLYNSFYKMQRCGMCIGERRKEIVQCACQPVFYSDKADELFFFSRHFESQIGQNVMEVHLSFLPVRDAAPRVIEPLSWLS